MNMPKPGDFARHIRKQDVYIIKETNGMVKLRDGKWEEVISYRQYSTQLKIEIGRTFHRDATSFCTTFEPWEVL